MFKKTNFPLVSVGVTAFLSLASSAFAQNNPSFPAEFYKSLSRTENGRNFTFSPYSISQAFGLAEIGARGETLAEIEKQIDPGPALKDVPNLFSANRIWVQKGFHLEKKYLSDVKSRYGADPGELDFVRFPDVATRTINSWVADQTHGKIKNLIPPNSLNESSRLVLTNALYFKAAWDHPFRKGDTYDDDFVLLSGKKARVPFMHQRRRMNYGSTKDAQILELPYDGSREAMFIVLPKKGVTLDQLEEHLSSTSLASLRKSLGSHDVRLGLPRFRFNSSFLLNDNLKAIGVKSAFDSKEADFSGMDGAKDLSIAQVFHKAFLKVNEAGTEAAAATSVNMMYAAAMPGSNPIEFTANRPFLFWIEDLQSKTILFFGRLVNPRD